MRITSRVILGFAALMIVFLVAHLYQGYFAYRVRNINRELAEVRFQTGLEAFELLENLKDLREFSTKYLVSGDELYHREVKSLISDIEENLRALQRVNLAHIEEGSVLDQILESWSSARSTLDRIDLISEDTSEPATENLEEELEAALSELRARTQTLILTIEREIEDTVIRAQEMGARATFISWMFLLGAFSLSVGVCFLIYRSVSGSLQQLINATSGIAAGDFEVRVDESGNDELAEYSRYLNQMARRLGEMEGVKRDFLSYVSHDLRAPLASIQETTRLLLDDFSEELNEVQKRLLTLNLQSSERLSELISDLLDLGTLQAGVMRFERQSVEMVELIQTSVEDHMGLCRDQGITVELQLPDCQPTVKGDPVRLRQLLGNLLSNAIKFSPEQGVITVAVDSSNSKPTGAANRIRISIADEGPGVPEEDRTRIFEQFYSVGRKRGGARKGTGLGLAISQKITDAHQGRIWVESNSSGGATFFVELPTLSPG